MPIADDSRFFCNISSNSSFHGVIPDDNSNAEKAEWWKYYRNRSLNHRIIRYLPSKIVVYVYQTMMLWCSSTEEWRFNVPQRKKQGARVIKCLCFCFLYFCFLCFLCFCQLYMVKLQALGLKSYISREVQWIATQLQFLSNHINSEGKIPWSFRCMHQGYAEGRRSISTTLSAYLSLLYVDYSFTAVFRATSYDDQCIHYAYDGYFITIHTNITYRSTVITVEDWFLNLGEDKTVAAYSVLSSFFEVFDFVSRHSIQ